MADNITLDAGSGGSTVRTDDDGTAHWQYVKLAYGADNTQTIVSTSNALPIDIRTATATVTVDLGANNDVTIDNSSIVKAEDAVHSSGDAGVMALVVRNDTLAALAGTDGDYAPLQVNASGALYVASHDVTNAGTFAVQVDGDALTALQLIDDVVFTDDTSTHATGTTKLIGIGAAATPTDGSVGANDIGMLAMSTDRRLLVDAQIVGTDSALDVSAATVTVDLGANNDVTIDNSSIVKLEDAVHSTGDAGVMALVVRNDSLAALAGTDGDYAPLQVNASGALYIQEGSALDVSAATVTVDLGANNDIQGDIAHDAADSGNPVKIGAKVETATSGATLAADGDRTDLYADSDGVILTRRDNPLADHLSERVSNTDGASTAFTGDFAASGAGIKNYVNAISIHNSSATDGYVDFRDGAAGSVLWTVPIPAGGGAVMASDKPLFGTTANTALAFDVSAALSTVYISVSGFKSKV